MGFLTAVNAVSPTVLSDSRENKYTSAMPGFSAVDAADVAQGYVRSVESTETGRIYEVFLPRALASPPATSSASIAT